MENSKLEWKHPKRSNPSGACVETAFDPETMEIVFKDSKQNGQPNQPHLRFRPDEIAAFLGEVRDGELDYVYDTKTLGGRVGGEN